MQSLGNDINSQQRNSRRASQRSNKIVKGAQDLETSHVRNKHGSMDNVEIKSKFAKSDEMSKSNGETPEMEHEDDQSEESEYDKPDNNKGT